jgi:hypothetical protein
MSEKQMCLIAYRESYRTMFRSIKKQLQDTELGTGFGTNRHTYMYVRYGWNQQAHVHVCTVWTGTVRLHYLFFFSEDLDYW